MTNKPENINYNAYHDDQNDAKPPKSNIKESVAKKSRFAKDESAPRKTAADFDREVLEYQKNNADIRDKTIELSSKFISALNNKTLGENKGPINEEIEKRLIKELCDIGLRMNNDSNQPEGAGSIGLESLLFKAVFVQRDKINELEHEIFKLKKFLKELKEELSEVE